MSTSPYLHFSREQWSHLRQDEPFTLTPADIEKLHGQMQRVSAKEIIDVYLPLSRLLSLYVTARQGLYRASAQFLGHPEPKVPYVIGVSGSVAVGKSTVARVLQALLSRWPQHNRVALVTTDGYLYPTAELERRNLMARKGFPETFDLPKLLEFLMGVKSGQPQLQVPVYSHEVYDILPDVFETVDRPDIVVLEGLNLLQTKPPASKETTRFVSDFLDFSIFVDAETVQIQQWYTERFMHFREKAMNHPEDFFYRFAQKPEAEAIAMADYYWKEINEKNLIENILPFKNRAQLILRKGVNHAVESVALRKL